VSICRLPPPGRLIPAHRLGTSARHIGQVHRPGASAGCIGQVHRPGASAGCIGQVHRPGAGRSCGAGLTDRPEDGGPAGSPAL